MKEIEQNLAIANTRLDGLKTQVHRQDEASIKKAAAEFEALFLKSVFNAMRKANETFKSDLFQNSGMKMYEDFLDTEWSKVIAKKGLGLGEFLSRQLKDKKELS